MTGFARVNGQCVLENETVDWLWEAKSVNGKGLEIKSRMPLGYDDLGLILKNEAAKYLVRGNICFNLEVNRTDNHKKAVVDEVFLAELTQKAIELTDKFKGKLVAPNAAELLGLKGVVEIEENTLGEEEQKILTEKMIADFDKLCANLKEDRKSEGKKIASALLDLLNKIEELVKLIENKADSLPEKLKQKLKEQLDKYAKEVSVDEDKIAQELVLLVTRADIREEIDRLKAHINAARELLSKDEAVGRRLDFLCQELNREANTTCSKSADIEITNWAMELKVLIEQFREQVQNIE